MRDIRESGTEAYAVLKPNHPIPFSFTGFPLASYITPLLVVRSGPALAGGSTAQHVDLLQYILTVIFL